MSKTVCEICGASYDDSASECPVCGWNSAETLGVGLEDDLSFDDLAVDEMPDTPPQKAKAKLEIPAERRRPAPRPTRPEPEEEEEEEEGGSNKFLVVILVILILALLGVSVYIGWTKIIKPGQKGDADNRPQNTISTEVPDVPDSTLIAETQPSVATEPTIPCTELSLVTSLDTLTFAGQYVRILVKYAPENTTDPVTYTSGNEAVVTVNADGRVTAVGEGETVIVITCGSNRLETPVTVKFASTATEATTAPGTTVTPVTPAGTTTTTTPVTGTTVATPSGGVLALKKTDVTISKKGVYITLELENGISADQVRWSTSDSGVATVWNGNVTAMGRGTCVIRAEYNGQVAECVVRCRW